MTMPAKAPFALRFRPWWWVRRVYDDRRYVDGARHAVDTIDVNGITTTACGRRLAAHTPAKAANRLMPWPAPQVIPGTRTCSGCLRATAREDAARG